MVEEEYVWKEEEEEKAGGDGDCCERGRRTCGRREGSRDATDEMRSFPPPPSPSPPRPPPFLVEHYCPTVDLDYTHTTGFRTDFHDADTRLAVAMVICYVKKKKRNNKTIINK